MLNKYNLGVVRCLVSFSAFAFDKHNDFLVLDHSSVHATDVVQATYHLMMQDRVVTEAGWFSDVAHIKYNMAWLSD